MAVKCLLWDFGDTLCRETFIWSSGPDWSAVYKAFDGGWAHGWNIGSMNTDEFARRAADHIALEPEEIVAHMRARCRHIEFFPYTYAFFKQRHRPQAIVTVNPDLWSDAIVPMYGLDQSADVIVTSWEEQTADKGVLCRLALDRMGASCRPGEALLIDNRQDSLQSWRAAGGIGYRYTTDAAFKRDVADGLDHLARRR